MMFQAVAASFTRKGNLSPFGALQSPATKLRSIDVYKRQVQEMSRGMAGTREHRIIPAERIGQHTIEKMNWQEFSKHVARFIALLIAAALVYWMLRATGLYEFTARENEGLNTLILLIGNIYAVMFAFVIFVIWGQFTDVENFICLLYTSLEGL